MKQTKNTRVPLREKSGVLASWRKGSHSEEWRGSGVLSGEGDGIHLHSGRNREKTPKSLLSAYPSSQGVSYTHAIHVHALRTRCY